MKAVLSMMAAAAILGFVGTAQAQSQSTQDACMGDYHKLCSATIPGGGRVAKCLVTHKDELTDGCKTALQAEAAKRQAGGDKQ
jgi:hypothetical protein